MNRLVCCGDGIGSLSRTVLNISKLKIITGTVPNVKAFFAIFMNVAHRLEPDQGSKLYKTLLNIAKHGEITTKFHLTGLERNRKLRQFNNVQYCTKITQLDFVVYACDVPCKYYVYL